MKKAKYCIPILIFAVILTAFLFQSFADKNTVQAEDTSTDIPITVSQKQAYSGGSYTMIVNYIEAEKAQNGSSRLSDFYGGAYIDGNDDLVVNIKGGDVSAKEKIKAITGNSSIIYSDSNYSFDELYEVYTLISGKMEELEILGTSISETKNIVVVNSKNSKEECAEKISHFVDLSMIEIKEYCSEAQDL